jgi:lysophospholipase L1-like esterase
LSQGASQTYTVTGTSVDLYYTTNGGIFTYKVDRGKATSVNTAGAYSTANRAVVSLGAGKSHTVTITATSGTVYFEGLMVYNGDETKGIQYYDDAHTGYTTSQFNAAQPEINPLLALIKPNLVTIELGANDYLHDTDSPAQVAANIEDEIDNIRTVLAAKPPSIVVILPYSLNNLPPSSGSYSWAQYVNAIQAIAVADPSVGILDLSATIGASTPGGWWSSDGLHANDIGQALIGTIVASYLGSQ